MSEGAISKCGTVDFRNKQKRLCRRAKRIINSWFQEQKIFKVGRTLVVQRLVNNEEQWTNSTNSCPSQYIIF